MTFATNGWWRMFFADTTPIVDNLKGVHALIYAAFGSKDSQTAHERQMAAIAAAGLMDRITVDVHPGLGHALGTHALFGPMQDGARDKLADAAARMLGASPGRTP
jgi:hypothetical protein